MCYHSHMVTVDSFGPYPPDNWEEIANAMNAFIEDHDMWDDNDAICDMWEKWNTEGIDGIPSAIYSE